jgi:Outer membrane protein beta-barrel domain
MRERKNIERLFQEKFKDFEATPNPLLWENIAVKLEAKQHKKRSVLPFWYKAAGVAALLLLGFFTADNFTSVFKSHSKASPESVLVKQGANNDKKPKESNSSNSIATFRADSRLVDSQSNGNNAKNSKDINSDRRDRPESTKNRILSADKDIFKNSSLTKEKGLELNSNSSKSIRNEYKSYPVKNENVVNVYATRKASAGTKQKVIVPDSQDALVSASNKDKTLRNKYKDSLSKNDDIVSRNNRFYALTQEDKIAVSNKKEVGVSNGNKNKVLTNKEHRTVEQKNVANTALASSENTGNSAAKGMVQQEHSSQPTIVKSLNKLNSEKRSPKEKKVADKFDENTITSIVSQKGKAIEMNTVVDSLAMAVRQENPLEKILREKESKSQEEKVVTQRLGKWKIKPNVAPIMARSSEGSPISGEFADNNKDYENNLSIGLGVDYAISKRVSIRTGLNKFNLGYNTNDIAYYADLNAKNLNNSVAKTVNLAPQSRNIIIEDKFKSSPVNSPQLQVDQLSELAFQEKNDGYLNQKMGYLEVPIEISYAVIDKKFGVQIITGVSTLFLNENKISVISSGLTTIIGEASNLNKVHLSTNIGVGFKYSFWKSFEANFEPTFKYQVNTFNANSGGFKPYLVGLYSGISFKF